jgi:tRNA threonylcarbamoyladenosine biosynthesis protein TsaE
MKKIEYSLDQIDKVAQEFIENNKDKQIITFVGGLGAGKTTFVQAILRQMGVVGPVMSPTYTYFNQHQAADGRIIYHFDLYRLKSLQEFEMAGFFEYLYQPNSIVFIEWPEIIDLVIQGDVCRVKLSVKRDAGMNDVAIGDLKRLLEYQ